MVWYFRYHPHNHNFGRMGTVGFLSVYGVSVHTCYRSNRQDGIRIWDGERSGTAGRFDSPAYDGNINRLGNSCLGCKRLEVHTLRRLYHFLCGCFAHCIFLYIHYTMSFHRIVPDPSWFKIPFAVMTAVLVVLQVSAFVSTVIRQRHGTTFAG
jgi:hypothetical protein